MAWTKQKLRVSDNVPATMLTNAREQTSQGTRKKAHLTERNNGWEGSTLDRRSTVLREVGAQCPLPNTHSSLSNTVRGIAANKDPTIAEVSIYPSP